MKILSEFREFISRGNVIDLAVGVIIGAAFSKIVSSLVDQVIMPPVGLVMGGVDFAQLKIVLKAADEAARKPEVAILYGAFINTLIQFFILAATVFLLVKGVNALRRLAVAEHQAAEAASPSHTDVLLTQIRDLLQAQGGQADAAVKPPVQSRQKGSAATRRK